MNQLQTWNCWRVPVLIVRAPVGGYNLPMRINFFDDPLEMPRPREEVRLKQLGFFVYPEGRRVAVGFELTPFLEKPSIELAITNALGDPAGRLTVIEALETSFSLTIHLRDKTPTERYDVLALVYYGAPGEPRQVVHELTRSFDASRPGEQPMESET